MKTLATLAKAVTLGALATAFMVASPATANAQVSVGVRFGGPAFYGPAHGPAYYGHPYYGRPAYVAPAPYGFYGGYFHPGFDRFAYDHRERFHHVYGYYGR